MEQLTGGDKLKARGLHKDPEFKPQIKVVMCCNVLKSLDNDDGTWRRIRVIEFISSFVDEQIRISNINIRLMLHWR